VLDLGTDMVTWQTPAQRNVRRRRRYGRFMSTPRAVGLVLMAVGVCAYGTAPDWLALSVTLLGLAANVVCRCALPQTCDCSTTFQLLDRSRDTGIGTGPGGRDLAVETDRLKSTMRRGRAIG
jgi:hypothetical protein